jgi:tRNA pseudouridine55 synthase
LADAVHGVLVIDKPRAMTSHDVVARVRRALGTREVGHAGTLDPMATGVLVVALGEATKLTPYLTAADKEYEATIVLGSATDTLDADGRVTQESAVPDGWRASLDTAIAGELGRTMQDPPLFSAIHTSGERAHERARRGESPALAPRPVQVTSLTAVATSDREIQVRLVVSKGYYVRALARDLSIRLGTVGHLVALRRVRSGVFTLGDAVALAAVDASTPRIPVAAAAAQALPVATLTDSGVGHARAGRPVPLSDLSTRASGEHAWLAPDGALVAVGSVQGDVGRVTRGFR